MNPEKRITPAYRIETKRLVIRCWQPTDAQMLKEAMDISVEHLRPFFPLAKGEPLPLEERIEKLRHSRAQFDLDQYYSYGVFNQSEDRVIGWVSITYMSKTLSTLIKKLTGSYTLYERWFGNMHNLGAWIRIDEINKGYSTEATGAMAKIAFEVHHTDMAVIEYKEDNAGSGAVARKLGFEKIKRPVFLRKKRYDVTTGLSKENYPVSPVAKLEMKAFDAFGRVIV